jgi:hypothetical protein
MHDGGDIILYILNPRAKTVGEGRKLHALKVEAFRFQKTLIPVFAESSALT